MRYNASCKIKFASVTITLNKKNSIHSFRVLGIAITVKPTLTSFKR